MRCIDNNQLPRVCDLNDLEATNSGISEIDENERTEFIDQHEDECSAIRSALWLVGSMKCWYSEALLQEGEGHVEHYRPKKKLWAAQGHNGYWWRAFDWRNLRLAHPTVNFRRTDYLTGKKAGKGSYFPLRPGTRRANSIAEETNEEPVLLDPVIASDTRLLCFAEDSGAPRPRYSEQQNAWFHQRAADSIGFYHLNEGTWNYKRADLMSEVRVLCEQLESLVVQEPRGWDAYNQKIDEIIEYIRPSSEFSSACRQVVQERGLLEHLA